MTDLANLANSTIIPSRSKFQLEHFVIGQHDTPEMRYQQILVEAADLAYKIKLAELDERKAQIEIDRLLATGDELDAIEAEKKQLGLAYTRLALESTRYEMRALEELFKQYPNYTYAEIEANQPDYWQKRLVRQMDMDIAERHQGISAANLQSMISAGLIEHEPQLELGKNALRNLEN